MVYTSSSTDGLADCRVQIAAVVKSCTSNCYDPTLGIFEPDSGLDPSSILKGSSNGSALSKRDGTTVNAHKSDPEMAFISQAEGKTRGDDFVYDASAGSGQTVYIVDTGARLDNNDV